MDARRRKTRVVKLSERFRLISRVATRRGVYTVTHKGSLLCSRERVRFRETLQRREKDLEKIASLGTDVAQHRVGREARKLGGSWRETRGEISVLLASRYRGQEDQKARPNFARGLGLRRDDAVSDGTVALGVGN